MVDPLAVFDQERRLTQYAALSGTETYRYDSGNRRIVRTKTGESWTAEVTFWSGGRMGISRYSLNSAQTYDRSLVVEDLVIGGRMVRPTDRLGSNLAGGRRMLPYGEEIGSTVNDEDKFATYRRDATGLDYADQRYYVPGAGRFLTADPYQASAGADDPGSWNRHAYVQGDPVNFFDPEGLSAKPACVDGTGDTDTDGSGNTPCVVTVFTPPVNVTAKMPGVDWGWVNQVVAGWDMSQKAANARIANFDWEEWERKERENQRKQNIEECSKGVERGAERAYAEFMAGQRSGYASDIAWAAGAGAWVGGATGGPVGLLIGAGEAAATTALIDGLRKFVLAQAIYLVTTYRKSIEDGRTACEMRFSKP